MKKSRDFHVNNVVLYNSYSHYVSSIQNDQQLKNGEIIKVIDDINYALSAIGYISISIYKNELGTIFALDTNGNPILNRRVLTIVYSFEYTETKDGVDTYHESGTNFIFDDFGKFVFLDTDLSSWYYITGVQPPAIKLLS
uniref:Uncharacterized protein n=1 Tax=viral metagenome TaxID=1070528 RepID=A0A6C0JMS2_9ZZZZ